ncbi:hypothetical protein AAF712_015485 [Marasmius tenuissimus]|uniref:SMP domain-containing protein n=1 Tax=Marasmius tenuissimus TaxID=585030 RepID=A0ABR2ZA55_9AGAR|nr:hypothetical protein PM082_018701 [Marasmius tenuissimus]
MTQQTFVGNEPVNQLPKDAVQQVDVNKLEQAEKQRIAQGTNEPGAATRAAVASRDPAEFDVKKGAAHGDTKPTQDPVM